MNKDLTLLEDAVDTLMEPVGASKRFFFSEKKYAADASEDLLKEAEVKLTEWENAVKTALSDKLPLGTLRHRPRNPGRRYPHELSGKLKESIDTGAILKDTPQGVSIHSWASIGQGAEYYPYANSGVPPRADGAKPAWIGWVNRVFLEGDGSRGIVSVNDIFNELVGSRHTLSRNA